MRWQQSEADEAAASWDARLRGARTTHRDRRAFQDWLQQDPEHQLAYDRLQAALRALRSQADLPELSALRDEARNTVHESKRRRFASMLSIAAGMAAILVLAAVPQTEPATTLLAKLQGEQIYTTQPHERTRVTLADGSLVTLDSATQMAVRLGSTRRDVTLLSGRALFKVAKDSERPFVVKAGNRTITALGTMFDVRVTPRELRVTLAEGLVSVRPLAAGQRAQPQILKPSQQLVAVAGAPAPLLRVVDISNALAWADRQFFFEDEPLISAVDEINRYGGLKIVVDPSVANLRINGMFRISDEAAFVEALKMALPVDVRPDGQGRLIVSRQTGSKPSANRVAAM
jgi:transmembrane sensor